MKTHELAEWFINIYKNTYPHATDEQAIEAYNRFAVWANGMAEEYFNSPYYNPNDRSS